MLRALGRGRNQAESHDGMVTHLYWKGGKNFSPHIYSRVLDFNDFFLYTLLRCCTASSSFVICMYGEDDEFP
jgi:hypothetical protein